ncbi:Alpha-(1,3)-fucosyltransferase 9 [Bagarius yarrelli]|uniref:Alpha-(1,3)-fucosyltransferase 9 n=1 Tax=Bagarius yarrelli TaxID=175774 RepID=A0A556VXR0_BAGYA|nr:Alpha-(1,3)-fucosyltransferase 9 [Bagarius yarrelli]
MAGNRVVLLVLVSLLCFEGLFHGLYIPSLSCNNETKLLNTIAEVGIKETLHPASTRRNQEQEELEEEWKQEEKTVVLVWKWPFGHEIKSRSCYKLFHITGCLLTADRHDYDKAHGVMFHHRDIQENMSEC